MHKEILRGMGFIGNIPHFEYLLFFFSGLFLWLSLFKNSKKVEFWICQNCHTKLVRQQIKFGLCPKCGVKVEGFRGLSHEGTPTLTM